MTLHPCRSHQPEGGSGRVPRVNLIPAVHDITFLSVLGMRRVTQQGFNPSAQNRFRAQLRV
jgi:hypothetical protein